MNTDCSGRASGNASMCYPKPFLNKYHSKDPSKIGGKLVVPTTERSFFNKKNIYMTKSQSIS